MRELVLKGDEAFEANDITGVTGNVGEWLWYLSTRDLPPEPGRSVEILDPPSSTVTDSGPDGLVIHRVPGSERGFVFRLWEMKKFTAEKSTTQRVRRRRPVSVSGALRCGMRAFRAGGTSQSTPNPEGPHSFKAPRT